MATETQSSQVAGETGAPVPRHLKWVAIGAAAAAGVVVIAGLLERANAAREVKGWTEMAAIPTVAYVTPAGSDASSSLSLPGTLQPMNDAQLFARVPGYVHGWYKDIGAKVQKGDLLAIIDTPELDQQIAQARADLANASSAKAVSQTTANRWKSLLSADAVSKQEAEEKAGDLATKTAQAAAAKANLDRLLATKSFSRIVAPFAGVVTSRTAEVGALANTNGAGPPLFTVADVRSVRVLVHVPQAYSAKIKRGLHAELTLPEYPGQTFPAVVDTTSDAISQQSGTLLVQLVATNREGRLKPGSFVQAKLALPGGSTSAQRLPATTLIFRAKGLQVATIGADSHIHLRPVVIVQDDGAQVEIASTFAPGDRVVDNPPDSLAEGDLVRIAGTRAATQAGAGHEAR
jgi:multidrug efflux system membrane fusion protein